jgi:hypothetical protein
LTSQNAGRTLLALKSDILGAHLSPLHSIVTKRGKRTDDTKQSARVLFSGTVLMNTIDEKRPANPTRSDPTRPPEDHPGNQVPPNPCSPATDGQDPCDCGCNANPGIPSRPEKPRKPKARPDDCCDQMLDLIGQLTGKDRIRVRKPKQRPARKVQALCDAFGVADAIVPLIAALWTRQRSGADPRNAIEKEVFKAFQAIDPTEGDALTHAIKQYEKLRKTGKADCLFNDCLAHAAEKGPIESSWVAEEILREGLKVAGQTVYSHSDGIIGPGLARLWDNAVFRGPNGSGATIYQGPWPWITAVRPEHTKNEEFGNLKSFRPAPGTAHVWQNYQYAQECTYTPGPGGTINASCARQHPPPPSPGSLFGNPCEGGMDYSNGNDCLRIPSQMPGGSISLRGFNFITPSVKVRVTRVGDPSITQEVDCVVFGDRKTPLKDDVQHFIVDERVQDWVDVPLPSGHPTMPGAPLPAGLYEVKVRVQNVTNVVYDSGVPPWLESNAMLVRIEADPNVKYLFWSNNGRCNRETPGMGDDEIWWDAFVGHVVPSEVPVPSSGASSLELRDLDRRSFPRGAWEDMDDGESAGAYSIDIFGPKPFLLGGVVVVGMVGFEVDSEDAAKDQLKGFWNAWATALKAVVSVALGAEGTATGLAGLAAKAGLITARLALSVALIALAVIAAVTLIATALWAAWAPADLIALDIMSFDSSTSWDKTDPAKALPPASVREFGDPDDGDNTVSIREYPLPKLAKPGDAAATWVEGVLYETPDDGEDASYTLEFNLART